MNKRKIFSLSYFLGRAFFLGFGFSLLSKMVNKDAWFVAILGTVLGSIIIWLFQKGKEKMNGSTSQQKSLWKWVFIGVFFLFNLFVYTQIVFIFQTFASSFFLIKSPVFFISLPIPFIIYRVCKNSYLGIAKVAESLLPIALFLFLFGIFGLTQNFEIDYFKPILTTSPLSLIEGTIFFACYSTAPFFLLLNTQAEENHFVLKYMISCFSILILCIFIIGVLGPNLMQIYRYPEYMTMKKIRIFNFIEKVENIVAISWLFDSFITLSICGNNIKETLPKKGKNIMFAIILILLYGWSILSNIYYQEGLFLYHIIPIILGIFEIAFLLLLFLLPKRKS